MSSKVKSISTHTARIVLGIVYFVFGLNFFLHFIPMPPPPAVPGPAEGFMAGLFQAGYFFPMLKGIEVLLGGFLLLGFFVPLSLVILAPISINILLFHVFLAPDNSGVAILIIILNTFLLWSYREYFKGLLRPKAVLS